MASLLLVDDDRDILKLGSHVLSAAGHFVFTAADADEALAHLNDKKIDLMITDANMPRHSGYDLLQSIKKSNQFKNLPVAFLTGRKEKKDIELALKLGVTDYIVKPLDPFLLIQKVNQILNQKKVESHQLNLAKAEFSIPARLMIDTELTTISEVGLEISCAEKLAVGNKIHINTPLFEEIGIPEPFMKVLSCIEIKNTNKFYVKVQFLGLKEKDLTKIRAWIFKHGQSKVA